MFLSFPNFNLYSTPLLILVVQGYLFAALLLYRFWQKRQLPDVFLALLCAITAYQCTSYTVGFMGWYDTFRNTKINYYLLDVSLAIGPTVYLYVRSVTDPGRGFRRLDWWHYVPALVWIGYEFFVWAYDSRLPGYWDQQNGWWVENIDWEYVQPFESSLVYLSKILYYAFAIHLYWSYRRRILAFFSNTYRVQLNWLGLFLVVYCVILFVIQYAIHTIDTLITDLHWQQEWWAFLAAALTAYFLGMKGYYTDLSSLLNLTGKAEKAPSSRSDRSDYPTEVKSALEKYMREHRPYLVPDLTLAQLAQDLGVSATVLSLVINAGFGKNFNDFINQYRVEAVKGQLQAGVQAQKSLLGIALDCGFNSKATFNRTFKKFTHLSPSEYSQKMVSN